MINTVLLIVIALAIVTFAFGIRIVRPMERGLIERLGKYNKYADTGFNWIIPIIDRIVIVNISEQMVNVSKQEVITKDNLNTEIDAMVYFKVKDDETSVKASVYNVSSYRVQIVSLAQTTLRNQIGKMSLVQCNSERSEINMQLQKELEIETKSWGIAVVRTELQEIRPPQEVQNVMNQIVIAENKKKAAQDFAFATQKEAEGIKMAAVEKAKGEKESVILRAESVRQQSILEAEGQKQAIEMKAEADAKAIKLVNEAAQKYFTENAQLLKKYETFGMAFKDNAKLMIVPADQPIMNIINGFDGQTLPIPSDFGKKIKK